jgi:hypothetical protein
MDENGVISNCVKHLDDVRSSPGQPTQVSACSHAAHKDVRVLVQVTHANAVTQNGTTGEGAGSIYRHDSDSMTGGTV